MRTHPLLACLVAAVLALSALVTVAAATISSSVLNGNYWT